MEHLNLEVITPVKTLYNATIVSVTVPGESGSFTILQDHAAIISILTSGQVRCIGQDGVEHFYDCKSGVVECKDNRVVVLIETK